MALNDLTPKEWVYRSKSIYKKSFGTNTDAHKIRRINKACKPPKIASYYIEMFSKEGDLVLDPLAGTGGILIGAQMSKRKCIGYEIREDFVKAYHDACDSMSSDLFDKYNFDKNALKHGDFLKSKLKDDSIDLVATDVPYFDMDNRQKSKRRYQGKDHERPMEPFGDKFKDLDDWGNFIDKIFKKCASVLKPEKYLFTFLEDMYINGEYVFVTHICAEIAKKNGLIPQGEFLWHNEARRAGLWGYPSRMVTSRNHTSILYFRKSV